MIQPKISIITITFNSEKTLERTIQSITAQDYANLEYIVVDGGSSDSTLDIIKCYGGVITRWISEPDKGISDAFNKGIRMATGDIIGIINSDDGLIPGALQALADAYDPTVDVYRGKVLLWKEDSNTRVVEVPSMHFDFTGMSKISHQGTFVARNAYDRFGVYDESCRYAMDYDLLLRYERAGAVFKYVDATLAFYSLGGLTFTSCTRDRLSEIERIMCKNGASRVDILKYRVIRSAKNIVKKIISKETLMRIRNFSFREEHNG